MMLRQTLDHRRMPDERHPRFNSFVTSEGHAKQKGRKRMRGSDASEAGGARSAHAAKHLTRRLLSCHELLSIRILMDNNSATMILLILLLYTSVDNSIGDNSIVYKCVVHDTAVSRVHVRSRHYSV